MAVTVEKTLTRMKELADTFPRHSDRLDTAMRNFTRHQKALQGVIAQVRQIELSRDQARSLFDRFAEQRQMLVLGLIQIKARYAGDAKLPDLVQIIEKIVKQLDDVLICLQILLDAFDGYAAPDKLPKTLGPVWEKVLDHVLLYHELQARMKGLRRSITLAELDARYGL